MIPADLLEAEIYYKRAIEHDVTHIGARMELASIYLNQGRKAQSYQILDEGFDFRYGKANAIQYYNRMALVYLEMGDLEKHEKAMQRLHSAR